MTRIDIITLFPEMFAGPFGSSIVRRAIDQKNLEIQYHQLRDYAGDSHGTVDDTPYGGGVGMVLKVDVIDRALRAVQRLQPGLKAWTILTTPQGEGYRQNLARGLAQRPWLIIICGHYEGYDERVRNLVDQEVSIGDYIVTGGEIPTMVIVDSVARLIPGVLGKTESLAQESYETGLLEYPQYTRPEIYNDQSVPAVLRSGNHQEIKLWRAEQARLRTAARRPDLLK